MFFSTKQILPHDFDAEAVYKLIYDYALVMEIILNKNTKVNKAKYGELLARDYTKE